MTGVSRGANLAIASSFPWKIYQTFVDVGTAQGDLAAQVSMANPHLRGTGFDLPAVGPIFEEYIRELKLSNRLQFAGGDFFAQPLPNADVIMMGHILHDWDLSEKKRLIKAAWTALPVGGAFIAYDALIDDERKTNAFGLLMSLNMLIETPGGFDYTGADCVEWMKEAGFPAKPKSNILSDLTRWWSVSNRTRAHLGLAGACVQATRALRASINPVAARAM